MNEHSPTSKQRRSNERPTAEADRRFALLVALMAPERRLWARSRPRTDEADNGARPPAFDPLPNNRAEEQRAAPWQRVIVLLFARCVLAAILFIVVAALIQL